MARKKVAAPSRKAPGTPAMKKPMVAAMACANAMHNPSYGLMDHCQRLCAKTAGKQLRHPISQRLYQGFAIAVKKETNECGEHHLQQALTNYIAQVKKKISDRLEQFFE